MKVLMFGWEFPPHISGGLGTASYGLTKGMSKIPGMKIKFVVPKAYGDEDQSRMRILGANDVVIDRRLINHETFLREIEYIEINSKIVPYTDPDEYYTAVREAETTGRSFVFTNFSGKLHFTGKYGSNLYQEIADYAVVAASLAEKGDFEIIHAHDWLTFPAGIAAKRVSGKPLVIHVHATDFDRSGGSVNPAVFDIEMKGMRIADKIIAVSNLTRNTIIEKYGIDPEKVVTVHNAVEPLHEAEKLVLERNMDDKIVTFLGRVTLQKGPEYFVEAAYKVLQKMDNVRFVMAGSGELLNRMIMRAASLRIANKFHFTGFLKGDDVYKMFSLSDVYVMPSVSEPFGISPLEAMQSNVPVIISHQSGVSEVLQYALKVDFWDIDAMADAIYGLLNYSALSDMFKVYGKEEVENMKWENAALKVNEVYKSVI
ncbi:MAG: glycosyltransferase family 4 protein [Bacteroidales bacterium]|nr:glycosyltransferase family 4 protein [Bacteroidales bacterium]MCB8998618.1 glycosyltransferase family 4 protein [Bacteroidales bacterium]MCB9012514.1 glycosyltransferase family 4 protein [Bacteroidales bacterium]